MPFVCASAIALLTPSHRPKSSALIMSNLSICGKCKCSGCLSQSPVVNLSHEGSKTQRYLTADGVYPLRLGGWRTDLHGFLLSPIPYSLHPI
jgi:hypothetical protein